MTEMSIVIHDAVRKGTCVILYNGGIVYAGSIIGAPYIMDAFVLMHKEDSDELKKMINTHKGENNVRN